jgi:hypothetical protein
MQPTWHLVNLSWFRAPYGAHDQMLVTVSYGSVRVRCSLRWENGSVIYQSYSQQYHVSCQYVYYIYSLHVTTTFCNNVYVYIIYTRPLSVQVQYSRSFHILSSSCYNSNVNWPDLADGIHYIASPWAIYKTLLPSQGSFHWLNMANYYLPISLASDRGTPQLNKLIAPSAK